MNNDLSKLPIKPRLTELNGDGVAEAFKKKPVSATKRSSALGGVDKAAIGFGLER